MKNITIKDVAREANVSVGSVHLAINGKAGITEKNRQHILSVADSLGYRPNILASNLKRDSRNIAIVLPKKDEKSVFYYDYMWKAVDDFKNIANDYNLNIVKFEYTNFAKTLNEIDLTTISGLITVGYPVDNYKEAITRISDNKIPIILIDGDFYDLDVVCTIKPDTKIIGRLTGELLLNTIHRYDGKILVCGGDKNYPNHFEIIEALSEYLDESNIKERLIVEHFWEVDSLVNSTLKDIIKNNNIVGCCSVNSRSTVVLSEVIKEMGLAKKIPVIGNGVFKQSIEYMKNDTITSAINKRPYEQCYKALESMSNLLAKNIKPNEKVIDIGVDVVFKSLLTEYEKKALEI